MSDFTIDICHEALNGACLLFGSYMMCRIAPKASTKDRPACLDLVLLGHVLLQGGTASGSIVLFL
jgi:hypothetical protein